MANRPNNTTRRVAQRTIPGPDACHSSMTHACIDWCPFCLRLHEGGPDKVALQPTELCAPITLP